MLSFLRKKLHKEDGSANTVSFIVIMMFVMTLLISVIDIGLYFNVKNETRAAAEAGARNVALYGGTSSPLRAIKGNTPAESVVESAMKVYSVMDNVSTECGPGKSTSAGDEVWCVVKYRYKGIAGNFSIFRINDSDVTVKGVTVSEVGHD